MSPALTDTAILLWAITRAWSIVQGQSCSALPLVLELQPPVLGLVPACLKRHSQASCWHPRARQSTATGATRSQGLCQHALGRRDGSFHLMTPGPTQAAGLGADAPEHVKVLREGLARATGVVDHDAWRRAGRQRECHRHPVVVVCVYRRRAHGAGRVDHAEVRACRAATPGSESACTGDQSMQHRPPCTVLDGWTTLRSRPAAQTQQAATDRGGVQDGVRVQGAPSPLEGRRVPAAWTGSAAGPTFLDRGAQLAQLGADGYHALGLLHAPITHPPDRGRPLRHSGFRI